MKNLFKITALLGMMTISFIACRKDYTCNCIVEGEKRQFLYYSEKKTDAQLQCENTQSAARLVDSSAYCSFDY